ncbi:hypothetical protein C364_03561 [Cryptococcus neoformans Bt63]|nr:hypothetical protein C364_03561 [Cryptococcus neoformans var. grubii Bt63]
MLLQVLVVCFLGSGVGREASMQDRSSLWGSGVRRLFNAGDLGGVGKNLTRTDDVTKEGGFGEVELRLFTRTALKGSMHRRI